MVAFSIILIPLYYVMLTFEYSDVVDCVLVCALQLSVLYCTAVIVVCLCVLSSYLYCTVLQSSWCACVCSPVIYTVLYCGHRGVLVCALQLSIPYCTAVIMVCLCVLSIYLYCSCTAIIVGVRGSEVGQLC